jgi:uncharacterized lipoprotein YbaY
VPQRKDEGKTMEEPLVRGKIVFDPEPEDLSRAKIYIRLADTSLADAPSRVVSEQVLMELPPAGTAKGHLSFALHGALPDPRASYSVSVHVDMQNDGKISQGDYINMQSYPVLTYGYPDRITLLVRRV